MGLKVTPKKGAKALFRVEICRAEECFGLEFCGKFFFAYGEDFYGDWQKAQSRFFFPLVLKLGE